MLNYKITFIEFSCKTDHKINFDFSSKYDIDKMGDNDQPLRDEIYAELSKRYSTVMIYNIEKQ